MTLSDKAWVNMSGLISPLPVSQSPFLNLLPLELRLEIYAYLLVHPQGIPAATPSGRSKKSGNEKELHPAILLVNRQINAEGTPVLYGKNTFLAHPTMLSGFPRLRADFAPVKEAAVLPRIRRFHVRLRLDCDVGVERDAVTKAFSGVEELVVDVWQTVFWGADHEALRVFEGVRGVRRVSITGSTTGFDEYARWLEKAMGSPMVRDCLGDGDGDGEASHMG